MGEERSSFSFFFFLIFVAQFSLTTAPCPHSNTIAQLQTIAEKVPDDAADRHGKHTHTSAHTHTRSLSGNRPAAMAHRVALRCQGPAACQRCRSLQPAQRQEVCRLSGEKTTRLLVKNCNALFNPRLSLCHPFARRDSVIGHTCDLRWCWWAALGPGGGVGIKAKRFFLSLPPKVRRE